MIPADIQHTTQLLDIWATLLPGQYRWLTVDNINDLYTDTLRHSGLTWAMWHPMRELSVLVGAQPSWLLPPVHPAFYFEDAVPLKQPSFERYDLWLPGQGEKQVQLNDHYFDLLFATRMERNWWLRYLPGATTRLKERLLATGSLVSELRKMMTAHYSEAVAQAIVSVVLTGSFLWSEQVPQGIDVAVFIESSSPAYQYCFDHRGRIELSEPLVVDNTAVPYLDLLVVGVDCLENPGSIQGSLGRWHTRDGELFPHDLDKRTVYSATQQTFAAGIPVYGRDYYQQVSLQPRNLLALAYYFTQVASALLVYREGSVKAAQRLLESNLILNLWEDLTGTEPLDEAQGIIDRSLTLLRQARCNPKDSHVLADLQGWWGREPKSLLELTVNRLVHTLCSAQPALYGERTNALLSEETALVLRQTAHPLGGVNASAAERALLIPYMELLAAELAAQRTHERCRVASQSQEPAWRVLLAKLEHTPYAADLARLVYVLTHHPEEEGDRHILPEIQTTDTRKRYVIRDVSLSSEEILSEMLVLYERYHRLLPRSHYFNGATLLEVLPEYERATQLCALTNGFLGNTPLWMWLSEPLENLSYGVEHVQSALRVAQMRYFSHFTGFERR